MQKVETETKSSIESDSDVLDYFSDFLCKQSDEIEIANLPFRCQICNSKQKFASKPDVFHLWVKDTSTGYEYININVCTSMKCMRAFKNTDHKLVDCPMFCG